MSMKECLRSALPSSKLNKNRLETGRTASETQLARRKRISWIDTLRGITVVSMVLYHRMWDLVNLYGISAPWYRSTPGYVWEQSICWTFILIAGFCWSLDRHPLRRGLIIFGCGALVSIATLLYSPDSPILFGILTFIGTASLLMIPLKKLLNRIPASAGLALSFTAFVLLRNVNNHWFGFESWRPLPVPSVLYQNLATALFGFPGAGFYSSDYFALIPWIFLYMCGFFLYRIWKQNRDRISFLQRDLPAGPFAAIGRHALIIYILHQPVLILLLMLIMGR